MKKFILASTIILFSLLVPNTVLAHSGRTDSSGGHNCYTGSCAGTYHYHNGGGYSGGGGVVPVRGPVPSAVKTGTQNYYTSADNWCNYDVIANWDSVPSAIGYSVSLTKTAGGNPGSVSDTAGTSFTFKNREAGTWYLNIKAGNANGWGDIVYWTLTLPKMNPVFEVSLAGDTINYDFSCQNNIEAPQFVIDGMKNMGNSPKGSIKLLNTTTAQTLLFKGTDRAGKKYEKTISFAPPSTPAPQVQGASTANPVGNLIGLGALASIAYWAWKKRTGPTETTV